MNENQFKFTLDNFNDSDGRKEDIKLATALSNLKDEGWIEAKYHFLDIERFPFRTYKLVFNDIAGKNEKEVLEILNKYVHEDRIAMLDKNSDS